MSVTQSTPQRPCEEDPVLVPRCKAFAKEHEDEKHAEWERQQDQQLARSRRPQTRYFDQWNHETGKPADINDMSAETLVQIFSQLDGHRSNFRTLALTCRRFRDLLKSDEYRIAYYMSQNAQGFEQLILENSTVPNTPLTYKWLWNAYDRGHRLRLLIDMFEYEGMMTGWQVFPTSDQTHRMEDTRRLLATVLLAAEIVSCKPTWDEKMVMITQETLYRSNDLLRHFRNISFFIVKQDHRFVDDATFLMNWGSPRPTPSGLVSGQRCDHVLAAMIPEGILLRGPSALVDLLARRYRTLQGVETRIVVVFFQRHLYRYPLNVILPAGFAYLSGPCMSRRAAELSKRREAEMQALGETDELGLFTLDRAKWCTKIKNDKDWIDLMRRWGWTKTIKLIPPRRSVAPQRSVVKTCGVQ